MQERLERVKRKLTSQVKRAEHKGGEDKKALEEKLRGLQRKHQQLVKDHAHCESKSARDAQAQHAAQQQHNTTSRLVDEITLLQTHQEQALGARTRARTLTHTHTHTNRGQICRHPVVQICINSVSLLFCFAAQ